MLNEIAVALISSLIGGLLVAVINHLFTKRKTEAETDKIRAEADKIRAESEKIRLETAKFQNEVGKLGDTVGRAESIIKGGLFSDESEATSNIIRDVVLAIHTFLQKQKIERIDREMAIKIIVSFLKDDRSLAEFTIDNLCSKGYLIETSPQRYEISRLAKMKFFSGGIK